MISQPAPSRSEDLAAYSDAANELFKDDEPEGLPMAGAKLAGGTSFQTDAAIGKMRQEGYLDPKQAPAAGPAVQDKGSSADDQIRIKKSEDRLRRKDALKGELKSIYRDPKALERRVEERLNQEGL